MYADYQNERGLETVFENDFGFISYSISGSECFIQDCYVKVEHRRSKMAKDFVDMVKSEAMAANCTHLTCSIPVRARGATRSLEACLGYGFELVGLGDGVILLAIDLRGE